MASSKKLTIADISKMSIQGLIDHTIMSSALLAIIDVKDFIRVNPNYSYFKIMSSILKETKSKFEKKMPLIKRSVIVLDDYEYIFRDNFASFEKGILTEDYTILVPHLVVSMDTSLLHMRRSWRYLRPKLEKVYPLGQVYCDYMAPYPMTLKETNPPEGDFTEDSYVYYLNLENPDSKSFAFKKQFYVELLRYINNIKNNLRYPDLPIELLSGLETELQKEEQELFEYYRKSCGHAELLR